MLFVRILAFLGLLLLAPAAQAAPGDAASGPGLISVDALVEAPPRLIHAELDADGPDGLPVRQRTAGTRLSPVAIRPMSLPPVGNTRHPTARPRAPPFQKV